MVADPRLTPFTFGCIAGLIEPGLIDTVVGEIVTLLLSLLASVMATPPEGAGADSATANDTDCPGPTTTFDGNTMLPGLATVTFAVVSAINGNALAWMTVVPSATPVTGTVTLEAFPCNTTIDATVATAGLLELRLIARPTAGAGADKFNVRFCAVIPVMVKFNGKKLRVAVTCTVALAGVYPAADARTVADPKFTPLTIG